MGDRVSMRRLCKPLIAVALVLLIAVISGFPQSPPLPVEHSFNPLRPPTNLNVRRNSILAFLTGPELKLFIVRGHHGTLYLQDEVYGPYVNGTWIRANSSWVWNGESKASGRKSKNITVVSFRQLVGNLPVPLGLVNLSVPGYYSPGTGLFRTIQPVVMYTVRYSPDVKSIRGRVNGDYLTVRPEGGNAITEALRSLALNVTKGSRGAYGKVEAIVDYLKSHYRYGNSAPPMNVDPVYYFLFVSHTGICVDFNAALVVLARLVGIPARLVTGYLVMPGQDVVTSKNAHAWAQVYIGGKGWVNFDATAGGPSVVTPGESVTIRSVLTGDMKPRNLTIVPKAPGIYVYPTLAPNNSIEPMILRVGVSPTKTTSNVPTPIVEASPGAKVKLKGFNLTLNAPKRPGVYYVNTTFNGLRVRVPVVVGRTAQLEVEVREPHGLDTVTVKGKVEGATNGSVAVVIGGKTIGRGTVVNGSFKITVNLTGAKLSGGRHVLYAVFYAPGYLPSKSRAFNVYVVSKPVIHLYTPDYVKAGPVNLAGRVVDEGGKPVNGSVALYIDGQYVGDLKLTNGGYFSRVTNLKPGRHSILVRFTGSRYVRGGEASKVINAIKVTNVRVRVRNGMAVLHANVKGVKSMTMVTSFGTVTVQGGEIREAFEGEYAPVFQVQVLLIKGDSVIWSGSFKIGKLKPIPPSHERVSYRPFESSSHSMAPTSSSPRRSGGLHVPVPNVPLLIVTVASALVLLFTMFFKRGGASQRDSADSIRMERSVFAIGEEVEVETSGEEEVLVDDTVVGRGPHVRFTATTPGTHTVRFRCAERRFTVLPVRDAVVKLYEELIEILSSLGVRTVDLTPEEIMKRLEGRVPCRDSLKRVTLIFEAVKYGNYPPSMREFSEFVKALKTIEDSLKRGESRERNAQ